MSEPPTERSESSQVNDPEPPRTVSRRQLLTLSIGGAAGLALEGLFDVAVARAATQNLKLSNISEFTTSCNFCSCGCGMIAAVRDGKLISMEGDYDHIVSRGSLCVKGISMFATHASPKRLTKPLYRAPGSDHWEEMEWKDAAERVARKIKKVRDENWIATEKLVDKTHIAKKDAFGRGAMTNHWADMQNAKCFLVEGSNVAENHPMAFKWIRKAQENGAKIIHVDPRFTRTSAAADMFARIRPGTDAAFLNTMINYLVVHKLYDEDYVSTHTNALFLGHAAFGFKDGLFRGFDEEKHKYDTETWGYQLDANGTGIPSG